MYVTPTEAKNISGSQIKPYKDGPMMVKSDQLEQMGTIDDTKSILKMPKRKSYMREFPVKNKKMILTDKSNSCKKNIKATQLPKISNQELILKEKDLITLQFFEIN